MNTITHRITLFGLGFTELLSHIDLRLGNDAVGTSAIAAQAGSTQAMLAESLGLFERIAQGMVTLAASWRWLCCRWRGWYCSVWAASVCTAA